jgi:transcriptional regulator with PAS, ATPase and Fis domain
MKEKDQLDALKVADAVFDGIYVINNKGVVIAVNQYYTTITGIPGDAILGKRFEQVWQELDFDADMDSVFFHIKSEEKLSSIMEIIKTDKDRLLSRPGSIALTALHEKRRVTVLTEIKRSGKVVLLIGIPIFDEYGEVEKVCTVLRDLTDFVELKEKLEEAEEEKREYLAELNEHRKKPGYEGFIGDSPPIKKIRDLIENIAETDATVLITGGTGVGKEVVARVIHQQSKRRHKPYLKVNCAAIPDTLLESELFGYEKGAFTGAGQSGKAGLFEAANKGTILLDEIGEMPIQLQAKLLRVLQEKEIRRVGSAESISIDVRVIAATNQNIQEQIRKGLFREDLFYRLNVIPVAMPDLKDRKEDVLLLAGSFLNQFNKKYIRSKHFSRGAIEALEEYSWPGNIRELENIIERLILVGEQDEISNGDIAFLLSGNQPQEAPESPAKLKAAVDALERKMLTEALQTQGSTYKAAKMLGVNQSTIVRKAKALGIKPSNT